MDDPWQALIDSADVTRASAACDIRDFRPIANAGVLTASEALERMRADEG